jgi:transposase
VVEVSVIMRAFDPEVVDAVWAAIGPRIPVPVDEHPKGGHRLRIADRVCFTGILVRLVTGCSWVDAEHLIDKAASDTTLRARRDEWIAAGVFEDLADEALAAYDRVIGLDLSETSLDGSQHKAPCGGDGTGPNPTDRGRSGWKWSIIAGADGVPFGWATAGANCHDMKLLAPTLVAAVQRGLLVDIETLHLDRGYDNSVTRQLCDLAGIDDVICARKRPPGTAKGTKKLPLGMRWPIERTNSWLSNFGQLRRNTDRRTIHRLAQLALAVALLITAKLIDWRDHWSN